MTVLLAVLASPVAFDYLWPTLLLLLILVLLAGLGNLVNRMADWPHGPHQAHPISHRLHEFISHRHH